MKKEGMTWERLSCARLLWSVAATILQNDDGILVCERPARDALSSHRYLPPSSIHLSHWAPLLRPPPPCSGPRSLPYSSSSRSLRLVPAST
ncbi:hypothetical protein C8J57DRAFT_1271704, partial [Mycena rebaudengoi]